MEAAKIWIQVDPFPASDPPAPLEMKHRPGAAWHGEKFMGTSGVYIYIYIYKYVGLNGIS